MKNRKYKNKYDEKVFKNKPNYCVCCGTDLNKNKCNCSRDNLSIMFL